MGVSSAVAAGGPRQYPPGRWILGGSVLGVVYDGGVMLAADTLLSFGSLAKSQGAQRLRVVEGTSTLIGAAGEYADFQKIMSILNAKALEETTTSLMDSLYSDKSKAMNAASVASYLRTIMYEKRMKMQPYMCPLIVAGTDSQDKPYLAFVDELGTLVRDSVVTNWMGKYLALPLLREKWRPDLSEGEARALLEDCMKVLFYRDARASARIQLAKVDTAGNVLVSDPYEIEGNWEASNYRETVGELAGDGGF